jgi:glycosyltransferase involved in cell wall biosynthesis
MEPGPEREPATAPVPGLHRVAHARLLLGNPNPSGDRVFHHNIWFRGHNSTQSEGLLNRMTRVDCYLAMCSDRRLARAVQFRAYRATQRARHRVVVGAAGRRYRWMLTHSPDQIPYFPGPVVAQVDDPNFTPAEAGLLSLPNVVVCVVTAESAAERLRHLGVPGPFYVLPLGSEIETLTPAAIDAVRLRHRRPEEVVVGYIASTLRLPGDRHAENPLHNVEHLLTLWDDIHDRVPHGRLWLVGETSPQLRARVAGRADIVLHGAVPRVRALAYVANFDIALYPRTADQGVRASKIADYLGAGVPTVSYDYRVVDDLRQAGAGLLATTPADFVAAVERLATDPSERRRLADAARRAGTERDWRVLAPRFEREVLDHYLA